MDNEIQEETKTSNCEAINRVKCLNCGTEFEGKYCPECGQDAKTGRFTIRFIWSNLLAAVLGRDGGIGYTIKNLFTRPGAMIVEILNGKRRHYLSPFPTLFLALTFYVLVFTATGSKSMTQEDKVEWETEISENDTRGVMISKKANQLTLDGYHFYFNHYTLCYMLTLPLFVIAARRCYGKENRKRFYWAEYIVAIVYAMVMLVLYRCVINLIYPFSPDLYEDMAFYEPIAIIIALTACFRKMMGFSTVKTIWRSALTVVLYYIMLGAIALVTLSAMALFLVLQYHN